MKKNLFLIVLLSACSLFVNAQSVIDANEGRNPNDFYQQGIVVGKKAIPYPFLRESDVVWRTTIWRVVDFNESFNQFFYFPIEEKSSQGRVSLIKLLIDGIKNGDIPVYYDDDMLEQMDIETAMKQLEGPGGDRWVDSVDADGYEVVGDDDEVIRVKRHFDGEFDMKSVKKIRLKEFWYIDKQDTRQKVRIVGLQFEYVTPDIQDDEGRVLAKGGSAWSFCIPMDEMTVRQVLVNANAYDENNDVAERSYDDIFVQRFFDSYVTRESNVHNRAITDYLTGVDAIYESQMIEEKVFDIESDMWEY